MFPLLTSMIAIVGLSGLNPVGATFSGNGFSEKPLCNNSNRQQWTAAIDARQQQGAPGGHQARACRRQ
jgi:hypothetical protein